MRLGDTIGAPCTASGRSGRAAIRISGDRVHQVVEQLLDGAPSGRGAGRATFDLGGGRRLPVLVLRFDAGASYTSEDVLEILLPGNRVLVERVLARCLETEDVRLAAPGEFTARAYLNGRLSLEQAEGIGATIGAETHGQLASARDLLEGRTGRRYRAWADELTTILALVEAGIDFTDQEDVVAIAPDELRERVSAIEAAMGSLLGGDEPEATAADVPLVVLVGAPNAGKSTLFNALLSRRRSVVSELAGTTRDVIIERLDLAPEAPGAGEIRLADPAGLDAIGGQAEAQRSARRAIDEADVLIWCDPTGQFALEGIDASRPTIRVRTKADLPGAAGGADVHVCALDAWHLGSLRRAIADGAWSRRGSSEVVVTRHRRALANARAHLRAGQALDDAEVIAGELRAALDALGELVGRIHPDDVIGRVFATFCVGK